MKPDNERKIYSPVTGLWLAVRNDWLRWMSDDGYLLPSHEELPELLEQEKHRAEMEKNRAEMEKQRAERFAAKLRELGIPPEDL